MILVTRLNNKQFYVNAELIQTVESTPDTVITLTNYERLIVVEPANTVVERIIEYKRQTNCILPINKEYPEWI